MKKFKYLLFVITSLTVASCNSNSAKTTEEQSAKIESPTVENGQSAVVDDVSQKNVVQIAMGSSDHTTLVAAVKSATLVDVLSNAGPFTVFAPTNAAFDQVPAGTVEGLLKPEKKADLQNILQYHVSVGVFKTENMTDGQILGQANDGKVTIGVKDGKYTVNGANIILSIPASNGIVHVIDAVLIPPTGN
jgi:uncharacterized surface protein with fasciclin (FAS1) repeats